MAVEGSRVEVGAEEEREEAAEGLSYIRKLCIFRALEVMNSPCLQMQMLEHKRLTRLMWWTLSVLRAREQRARAIYY